MFSLLERLNLKVAAPKVINNVESNIEITEEVVTETFLNQISNDEIFVEMIYNKVYQMIKEL